MNDQIEQLLYDILEVELPELPLQYVTKESTIESEAIIIAGESGVLSGVDIARRLFEIVDDTLRIKIINPDMTEVEKGDMIMIIGGRLSSILALRGLVLSILQRLSSIASTVYRYHKIAESYSITIFDSEIVTPLFHPFEDIAFQHGHGSLFESTFHQYKVISIHEMEQIAHSTMYLESSNQLIDHTAKYIVEVDSIEDFRRAMSLPCDSIMLRQLSLADTVYCLKTKPIIPILLHGDYSLVDMEELVPYPLLGIRLTSILLTTTHMNIHFNMNR